jgi:hypothetical protein
MKALSYIALLLLLAGCATPYYSVPVSSEGDYYIAERQSGGSYYGGSSLFYDDLGVHPWWMSNYPVELFSYYSPYYYPHYFYVWQPSRFHPFYGYRGRYYAYWCPPYRPRLYVQPNPTQKVVASPAVRPPTIVTYPGIDELKRWNDLALVSRGGASGGARYRSDSAWKGTGSPKALPSYGRSASSYSQPGSFNRSSNRSSSRSSSRSGSTRGARAIAGKPYATHKQ